MLFLQNTCIKIGLSFISFEALSCKATPMKKILIPLLAVLLASTTQAQTDTTHKDPNTFITVTNSDYDMGNIAFGKPLEYNVYIKNISSDTLVIQDVKVTCGCTTPKFKTADKIAPGKSTFIVLGFNGSAMGAFSRTADIVFTNGLVKQVSFKGVGVEGGKP